MTAAIFPRLSLRGGDEIPDVAISFGACAQVSIEIPTVAALPRNDISARRNRIHPVRRVTSPDRMDIHAHLSVRQFETVWRDHRWVTGGSCPSPTAWDDGFSVHSERFCIDRLRAAVEWLPPSGRPLVARREMFRFYTIFGGGPWPYPRFRNSAGSTGSSSRVTLKWTWSPRADSSSAVEPTQPMACPSSTGSPGATVKSPARLEYLVV